MGDSRRRGPTVEDLPRGYLIAWLAFITYLFALEFLDPTMTHRVAWGLALLWFIVQEAIGGFRAGFGDMLSEVLWTFRWGGWSRGFLVGGFALWCGMRLYMLAAPASWLQIPQWLPRLTLASGLGLWLLIHLVWKGRHG